MTNIKFFCRAIPYDSRLKAILMVRNRNQRWWYAPGGSWRYSQETLPECAEREVFEETGVKVKAIKPVYFQTLYVKKDDLLRFEQFWIVAPTGSKAVPAGHLDNFGEVAEARWFTRSEMRNEIVYPKIMNDSFWKDVAKILQEETRYIGHFVI